MLKESLVCIKPCLGLNLGVGIWGSLQRATARGCKGLVLSIKLLVSVSSEIIGCSCKCIANCY